MKTLDPALDLVMTRQTHVPVELVWKAWTTPDLLKQWFTPRPWKTVECEIEPRPGGRFRTVMESPEGEQFAGESCVLQVEENRLLVWTSALHAGFRPVGDPGESFVFTAYIEMEPSATGGTDYKVTLIHADGDSKRRHDEMGFESGWGSAFDQLVELMSQ